MRRIFSITVIVSCAAAFAFGMWQLFQIRFETGDVYPEYSSLRADPLGTMALYESLDKISGVRASRDFNAYNQLPDGKGATYLHFAARPAEWRRLPEDAFKAIEGFLARGGRLIITFFPESSESGRLGDTEKKAGTDEDDQLGSYVSLQEKWGVGLAVKRLEQGEDGAYKAVVVSNETDLPVPPSLDWHSGIVCTNVSDVWQTIYARGENPVVIERKLEHGTVVIATDSYFVSNEAMLKDRHADLLAWLIGPNARVIFDEAHLGVTEQAGVAVLMRRYRLQWLVAGLVVLAGLFVWKNSSSLVPAPASEQHDDDDVAGKDAAAGFVNLLRRSISSRDLLDVCFSEWKKSQPQSGRYSADRLAQAESIFQAESSLPSRERAPLQTYQRICAALAVRNHESTSPTSNPNHEH